MPRTTKKEVLQQRNDPTAPFLLDMNGIPVRDDVLQLVVAKRYEHTGARLLENEEMTLALVEKLTHGWGVKRISEALHISPHTIRKARRVLAQQGKLAPHLERLDDNYADILEAGSERLRDGVEDGTLTVGQLSVTIGIISQQKALLNGKATTIVGHVEDKSLLLNRLNGFMAKLPVIEVETVPGAVNQPSLGGPSDSESGVNTEKHT